MRPWIHIRFGKINATRLGHLAGDSALYLAEKNIGYHRDYLDLFCFSSPASNEYLKKKLKPYFHSANVVKLLFKANQDIPGGEKHTVELPCGEDTYDLLKDYPLPLIFTPEEIQLGKETLQNLGISDGDKFVCFSNRESTYLDKIYPDRDWSYHDYRDSDVRNYIPAMEEMVQRGYYVLRMGSVVKRPLEIENPHIIDYACSQERNEFMDLYIYAHCHFAVGSFSGPLDLANSLGKPVVGVNTVPLLPGNSHGFRNTIIGSKLLFNESMDRLMTLNEIIDSNCLHYCFSNEFDENGIKFIENDSETIKQLAIELDNRINGIWRESKIQQDLQNKFWEIITNRLNLKRLKGWPENNELENSKSSKILWRMGSYFLKENPQLLQ